MRRLAALALAAMLLLGGCASRRAPIAPSVLLRLSVADQVCAGRDGTVPVKIYVTLPNQPPGLVRVLVNEQVDTILLADPTATLELYRVGYGSHTVRAIVGGRERVKYFSVWQCTG